jgi:hypothetical protein
MRLLLRHRGASDETREGWCAAKMLKPFANVLSHVHPFYSVSAALLQRDVLQRNMGAPIRCLQQPL